MIKLRALISSEDSYDLRLGPLHRIIVGLSGVDFQMQMDLEPSRINDCDWMGVTPLMWAAIRSSHTYINLLLSRGARIDLTDSEGRTALHHAVRAGSLECVRALLNACADMNIADNIGFTPLHDAGYSICASEVKHIITLLCDYGADLEARDANGWTPLYFATDWGQHGAVVTFLECGADVNALDWHGIPPIGRAIFHGHDEIVRQLCQCRGIVSAWSPGDDEIENILEMAALYGTVETMDILGKSAIPPIKCNVAKLEYWFNTYREVYGTRSSPEEELAAFQRLLKEKAIPTSHAEDEDEDVDSLSTKEHLPDNKSDESDDEQDEVFEDAMEHVSFLTEHSLLSAPCPVVAS